MSENVYRQWKRRWPILKYLWTHFAVSQKIIVATAVLHNIGKLWMDELEDKDLDDDGDEDAGTDVAEQPVIEIDWESPAAVLRSCG